MTAFFKRTLHGIDHIAGAWLTVTVAAAAPVMLIVIVLGAA